MKDRERIFVEEYLIDLNATAAALRAGYAPSTARNAAEWIKEGAPAKPKLRKELELRMAERSKRTGITADRVLNELAKIAFVNATDVIDEETARVRKGATNDDRAAIRAITRKSGNVSEHGVELYDKTRALELLGRHLGMFTDNVSIGHDVPVIIDDDGVGGDAE